jgi:hypothetical protein
MRALKSLIAAMRILSWNYRGLSRPAVVLTLRSLDQSPDIIFSVRNQNPPQVSAALNRLGFFLMSQVAASWFKWWISSVMASRSRP